MAGAGEACSHVGAILFAVETAVRLRDARTPASSPGTEYKRLKDIEFSSLNMKKQKMDNIHLQILVLNQLSSWFTVYSTLFQPPHNVEPRVLRELTSSEALSEDLNTLTQRGEDFLADLHITQEMVDHIQGSTRGQQNCSKCVTISCAHHGSAAVKRHAGMKKHLEAAAKLRDSSGALLVPKTVQATIDFSQGMPRATLQDQVCEAEAIFAMSVVSKGIPYT
ncbi:hypothetical protein HPB50_007529 [Hyalomma asiaticum]|uniref:Uncharacterized protein n=1 Tax=Hyalomma asiaticum TaxID=266040 RepID=A0ACB7SSL0_HYAAI|nr:hypothetical protein HPB50_007529 [Hyalomma asiaticum]